MASVISGGAVALRLKDDRSPPDWSAEVLVGDPDKRPVHHDALRGRADAAWKDGWWTAEVVVTGPPDALRSQWVLRRDGTPYVVQGETVEILPGLLTAAVNDWYDRKKDDKDWVRQALAAARKTLSAAAGSSDLSLSVDGYSATFESRADLMRFIGQLERRLRRGWRRETVLSPC